MEKHILTGILAVLILICLWSWGYTILALYSEVHARNQSKSGCSLGYSMTQGSVGLTSVMVKMNNCTGDALILDPDTGAWVK